VTSTNQVSRKERSILKLDGPSPSPDREHDLIAGSAGALAALLALYRHRPGPAVQHLQVGRSPSTCCLLGILPAGHPFGHSGQATRATRLALFPGPPHAAVRATRTPKNFGDGF
jgi:hypothetical protein